MQANMAGRHGDGKRLRDKRLQGRAKGLGQRLKSPSVCPGPGRPGTHPRRLDCSRAAPRPEGRHRRRRAEIRTNGNARTAVVLQETGHWIMEERPEETMGALVKFL
jgi:hypothetical protein